MSMTIESANMSAHHASTRVAAGHLDDALEHLRVFLSQHTRLATAPDPALIFAQLDERMADCITQAVTGIRALEVRSMPTQVASWVAEVHESVASLERVHDLVAAARIGSIPPAIPVQMVARTYAQIDQLRDVIAA